MAYTPINWQTGDTITAEKMNKMDNGWGLQSTQLFSETATTVAGEYGNEAVLSYTGAITADVIDITFDGVDYTCPIINMNVENQYGYGGVDSSWNYNFSQYPFAIVVSDSTTYLATQTAGTFNLNVSALSIETSEAFNSAVVRAEEFAVVEGVTTFREAADAFKNGKRTYVLTSENGKTYHSPIVLINENTYEVMFITPFNNYTNVTLSRLSASSADGVLS